MPTETRRPDDTVVRRPSERILDVLVTLGFSVERDAGPDGQGLVRAGRADVCRYRSGVYGERWEFIVHPMTSDTAVIVKAQGYVSEEDTVWASEEVDHVESLFRALMVRGDKLPVVEFPSDYSLRKWVALATDVSLPRERRARTPLQHPVVAVRPGEWPAGRLVARSDVARGLVKAARLLDADFDRTKALETAVAAARMDTEGDPAFRRDEGAGWLARSARGVVRGRRRDMDLAWDKASHARVIVGLAGERDDMRLPFDPEADVVGRSLP